MRVSVVRIGNSRGIRIPKPILEQCRLGETVELRIGREGLLVRPIAPRSGWDEAFRRMAEEGDDALLDRGAWGRTRWDESEWRW